jgi:hypothetical protein
VVLLLAMVASQLRVPRVFPLPKKVLSHSTFKALLEKRRHTLDSLIVLLKAKAEREDAGDMPEVETMAQEAENANMQSLTKAESEPELLVAEPENGLDGGIGKVVAADMDIEADAEDVRPSEAVAEQDDGREAAEGKMEVDKLEDALGQGPASTMNEAEDRPDANANGLSEGVQAASNRDGAPDDGVDGIMANNEKSEGSGQEAPQEQVEGPAGDGTPGRQVASAAEEERKAIEKAELEERLNKLESKKHMLVQQLKQVLVREDSKKFVRPPLAPSPIPSPSSLAVSSSYYMPGASPLPSTSSSLPSPHFSATPSMQQHSAQKKDDDTLEEGELPEGGSPHQNASATTSKDPLESDRGPGPGGPLDWDRGPDRNKLVHSASWDPSGRFFLGRGDDRFYPGRERPTVSPKGSFGSRMGHSYYQPLSLRRNLSAGITSSGQTRFPPRNGGFGMGPDSASSPQESMPPSQFGDGSGMPSPNNGVTNAQSRPREKPG